MDIHSELNEPITPRQIFENMHYWKHEDSGYQTSFTPESLECSGISGNHLNSTLFKRKINFVGQLQLDCYDLTKEVTFGPTLNYSSGLIRPNGDYKESPQNRRGTKRVFQQEADNIDVNSSIPTPTSIISGGLRKLRFNENHKLNTSITSSFTTGDIYNINENIHSPYPTTPIKKNCRSGCKLSSPLNPKRPVKKLNFVIHSISCDTQALQPAAKFAKQETEIKKYHFKPNQKIDIIKLLYNSKMMPPIMKIFNYLSPEDIFNFKLVSPFWESIWNDASIKTKKKEYLNFLANVKENQENKMSTPKNLDTNQIRPLMERHNMCYPKQVISSKSPPGTPRTIRFKRYAKAASLDSRKQLSCVRCCQPAKVTEENSGEEWVECTSETCAYQFCKFCKCERHPDKKCFQYDLDGPSPSKRKKSTCAVGTKKSRKNLRRLLS